MPHPFRILRGWRPSGLSLGILVTLVWMLMTGLAVQHRHNVPSIAEFKGNQTNVATCAARDILGDVDVRRVNDCLDLAYTRELSEWKSETGTVVVLPPMLGWVVALLLSLAGDYGLLSRRPRQRA